MRRRALLAVLGVSPLVSLAACAEDSPGVLAKTPVIDAAILDAEIAAIAERAQPGELEVAVQNLEGGEMWAWNGSRRFPMQSVFKAPLGAAALAEVDAGRLRLDEPVTLAEKDISPPLSAIGAAWPGVATWTVGELLVATVGQSDNTAADVLMKRIGGPGAVTAWLRGKGVNDIRVDRYERELQVEASGMDSFRIAWKDWPAFKAARDALPEARRREALQRYLSDPRDTTTATGMLNFLGKLSKGELLGPRSTIRLLRIMTESTTGANRLKAGLPPGATLAHKTGTSATDLGVTAVTNDVGLLTLKDGRRYSVAVFLAASPQDQTAREGAIADVMRAIARAVR
ncbi:MAG: class A beta-lactamase [Caulobacter sp.]|nr:class A beta-lactamase [Caulobacter sp.]